MSDILAQAGGGAAKAVKAPANNVLDKTVKTPIGDAPVLPILILAAGAYLCWFAIHYWASDVTWPSDPIKALLTGKPMPVADKGAALTSELAKLQTTPVGGGVIDPTQLGQSVADANLNPAQSAGGVLAGGPALAADALQYKGAGYVFGGAADRVGNWDCSSFVSYCMGHDLGHALPGGGHYGDKGYPPHAHGPTTANYLLFGTAITRAQARAGDLVVSSEHMGIVISPTQYVSARTPAKGVGVDNLSDPFPGGSPVFRRVTT